MGINRILPEGTNCCGCGACLHSCPKHAIRLGENKDGYVYPTVDEALCVNCGACVRACSFQRDQQRSRDGLMADPAAGQVYAAVSKTTDLKKSASGGLFAAIAKAFLKEGGVVFGAAMVRESDGLKVCHIAIENEENLVRLQGSKYVQSDLRTSYPQIKDLLNSGKKVLFSGTPCQVAGLYGYLAKPYDTLYTIDIICHGVPSMRMFRHYLQYTESRKHQIIADFKFRDKSQGWQLMGAMTLENSNCSRKELVFDPEKSSYYQMFLNSYTYRENCYQCPYAGGERPGNITIGDYWCIELVHPELCDDNGGPIHYRQGVSCLIVNNLAGKSLMQSYGYGIELWTSDYQKAARYNGQLSHPSPLKEERKIVLEKYAKSYKALDQWYKRKLVPIRIKRYIRHLIPKVVKTNLKRLLEKNKSV